MADGDKVDASFIPARGRATALTVLVIVQLAVLAIGLVAYAFAVKYLGSDDVIGGCSIAVGGGMSILNLPLFLAATVVFLTWVYRAIANLPALGSMSCRFTPADAVWAYFIPFVNLVRVHQVMATIWTESQPPAVDEHGFYLPRRATLVNWWWGLCVFSTVVSLAVSNATVVGIEELRSLAQTQITLHFLQIVEAVLFLFMVRGAQKRQEEQWQDLERRRNVPQPSADALR